MISNAEAAHMDAQPDAYLLLRVREIEPNPANPRRGFNQQTLDELAQSIRTWGTTAAGGCPSQARQR